MTKGIVKDETNTVPKRYCAKCGLMKPVSDFPWREANICTECGEEETY